MSAIEISQLNKSFGSQTVLNDVSLHIRHGEFVAVLGPSGCGKTTLLRTIAGFEQIDRGTISIGGRKVSSDEGHIPPEQRQLAIVFQNYALWPHMSVEENVAYSLKVNGVGTAERRQRTANALQMVGLEAFGTRRPADLSGGQRQRVALARCLVAQPSVVLLDEPLANLDVHLRAAMEEEFTQFHRHTGATLLYITHDQQEAMAIADRVVVMDAGRVMQFATPETLYLEPANEMVARFIDDGRVIDVENICPCGPGLADVSLLGVAYRLRASQQQRPQSKGKICLHAASLRESENDEPGFVVTLKRITYRGGYSQLDVEPDGAESQHLTYHLSYIGERRIGDRIRLTLVDGWVIPECNE
ncbi:spermidine/putrescine ABC transporter ATP-binding protein [Rouxiella silvae]|uniref:Spermidine/putrescine ABC transporter ATP-binding protein n=1 Tax=Rouxiella silvae TaxID=1646373 RepID=A0ABX3U035_9GAMM|nr:ABC transporter ATP-binding protein [Rouxiella silvae]ORJ20683.1 spermidine/putrescine ABC transporter ATP-binding protein [Rouxiella silvae]